MIEGHVSVDAGDIELEVDDCVVLVIIDDVCMLGVAPGGRELTLDGVAKKAMSTAASTPEPGDVP